MNGGRDVGFLQSESIFSVKAGRLIAEAEAPEGVKEQLAALIAGEHASRPVGTVGAGGKSHDQQASIRLPQRWHWLSPVIPIRVGSSLLACYLLTMEGQARANLALDDFMLQALILIWHIWHIKFRHAGLQ